MPKILHDAVNRIKAKGVPESSAWAMATSTLQKAHELKAGSNKPTKLGVERGKKGAAWRHEHPLATGGAVRPSLGRAGRKKG